MTAANYFSTLRGQLQYNDRNYYIRILMFDTDKLSSLDALMEAQKIAHGPIVFQVANLLREWGILKLLHENKKLGMNVEELMEATDLNEYAIKVLCESGYSMGAMKYEDGRYFITRIGFFLAYDEMTNANFNYTKDVNYRGIEELGASLKERRPAGLQKYFNKDWETIYPYLTELPQDVKESWFGYDHFYSDSAFKTLVDMMAERKPRKILDIGGNTGKWAIAITSASPETEVTICDHPLQIKTAFANAEEAGVKDRVHGEVMDLLDHSVPFPKDFDVVWMSQFLDCFPPEDIIAILQRAKEALSEDGRINIIEPYWDRQQHEIGAYILINCSPYFTALANGTSKMYSAEDMHGYIEAAGLEVDEEIDRLGFGHTLTSCKRKS